MLTGATLNTATLSIATLNGTMCDDTMRHSSAATRSTCAGSHSSAAPV